MSLETRRPNPFYPTFGTNPHVLVGRDAVLDEFEDGFEQGVGAPGLTVLLTGQRGTGKTVLLNEYQRLATKYGWAVIAESSSAGLLDRLVRDHLPRLLATHSKKPGSRVRGGGVSVAGSGFSVDTEDRFPAESTLRSQVTELTTLLGRRQAGLVITVDEVDAANAEELRKVGEVLQHARREDLPLAFGGAGLSVETDRFLSTAGTTFLRRAERYVLGRVDLVDVAGALEQTVRDAGRWIASDALSEAAAATRGYPFLIQLVGHQAWRQNPGSDEISLDDVREASKRSAVRMGTQIHAPALRSLSPGDKSYLLAMSLDSGSSRTGQIAQRLNVSPQYGAVYRGRLIEAGVIEEAGHGLVQYAIPYLGDYLRRHTASDALQELAGPGDDEES